MQAIVPTFYSVVIHKNPALNAKGVLTLVKKKEHGIFLRLPALHICRDDAMWQIFILCTTVNLVV